MKRVLDSSVGVKWVIPEKDSDKALQLRDDFLNKIVELVSPDIFLIEAPHAITRAERQKRITPAEGAKALTYLLNTLPTSSATFRCSRGHTSFPPSSASASTTASTSLWRSMRNAIS